jgi:hypothetical protein
MLEFNFCLHMTTFFDHCKQQQQQLLCKVYYSPTNAQVIVLKTILKFTLK